MTQVKVGDLIKREIHLPLRGGGDHYIVVVGEVDFVDEFRATYKTVEVLVDENNPGTTRGRQGGSFAREFFGDKVTHYKPAT